jgi:uncharacterized protein (DUF697 family)
MTDWAALGDGLVVGSLAYRSVAAASVEAQSALAELPVELDRIELTRDPSQFLSEAQRVGYESWVQGHIGESVAANVLTQNGYEVEFAELPNQPGWDLIVNGVPMNVKVGDTAAANIGEHFEIYPEIPVITDTYTAAAFDHPDVYGVPGLEPDRIEQLSAEVLGDSSLSSQETPWDAHSGADLGSSGDVGESMAEGAAEASGGILDAGVPWLTVGASLMREDRLAKQYGGDAAESTGAIVADAAGVGIGAKIGAGIGTLFGLVGAFFGAIGGAWIGKSIVKNLRQTNVEAEIEKFRPKVEEIERKFLLAVQNFDAEYYCVTENWNAILEQSTRPKRRAFEAYIAQLLKEHDSATLAFLGSVYQLFAVVDRWLDLDLQEIKRRFPDRNPILKLLLPSSADAARGLAEAWIKAK